MISTEDKRQVCKEYARREGDSGSPEVQVALLTRRITEVTEHLQSNPRDYSSRRGLLMMVGRRNRLLRYLSRTDRDRYQNLIKRLGLRK